MTTETKLSTRQRAFINAYLSNGFHASQAAITAGYSRATARQQSSRLLAHPLVKAEIAAFLKQYAMDAGEVLARLSAMARGDLGGIWDESTGQVDWKKARETGETGLIKRLRHKTIRNDDVEIFEDEIELHDPLRALQLIGKQLGLFTDKVQVEATWQIEAVTMIRRGELDKEQALEVFDNDMALVDSLFAKASAMGPLVLKAYVGFTPDDWDKRNDVD